HWVNLAEKIAPSEANVLITGESGTGKEIMARFIHQKSRRSQKSFISINCAAIPENLLEAELFGYEKGAFTGAVSRRIGKFEEANGGTFLLDEISEMHPRLQAKLLRAIQERVIDRIGSQQPIKINIRIIATSNRNLMEAVKNQDFREDLFFRLNVVHIQLPLLKQRPKDIEALADHFIKKYSELNGLPYRSLSKEALLSLLRHPWIGNVRELENSLHRAVLLAQGDEIQEEDIFSTFAKPTHSEPVQSQPFIGKTVSEVERELILGTLYHCLGNRTQAANILGISIRTLRNKLREYMNAGIDVMPPQENIKMSSSR
ncbi:MAG: sigma-54-dependent Fis family transcriptional regulator, partial [Proteobacteria bacterium]|nr:sigma-54-dependent Fis family transcriptional regulator [Pseudomonadota bacterium]